MGERALALGLARRVSRQPPSEAVADALVLLATPGGLSDVGAYARCLKPGGVLYCEVERQSLGTATWTPGRVGRSLSRAGLTPVGVYWTRPDFRRHRMYLPLHVKGALRWYMHAHFAAPTPLHVLVKVGVRGLTGLEPRRFAPLAPSFAVTATAAPAPPLQPSVLNHASVPGARGAGMQPLVLTGGQGDWSRVTFLPFVGAAREPAVVLKTPRLPLFNKHVEREQALLRELRTSAGLDAGMRRSIPQPLGSFRSGDLTVAMETFVGGRPLAASSRHWGAPLHRKVADLRAAADWLGHFHEQTQTGRSRWDAGEVARWVEAPIAAYERAFGLSAQEVGLFAAARDRARLLADAGARLPIVRQHRDFGDWNVFRVRGELVVIDWEVSGVGPALCDLLYFVTHWSQRVSQARGEDAEARDLCEIYVVPEGGGSRARAARAALDEYLCRLRMDRRFVPLLLVQAFVEQALDRVGRLEVLGQVGPDPRRANQYVRWLGVLAGHTEALFGAPP